MQAIQKVVPGLVLAVLFLPRVCLALSPAIEWQDWSEQAFAQAKSDHKLILLDVNAAWCHWCHVMEDTTYKDPQVIELVQKHFLPIKVDVDSRPDIAHRYGPIGWPATAFFTPDAQSILEVGAYIAPQTFRGILADVLDSYSKGTWKQNVKPTIAADSHPCAAKPNIIQSMNAWTEKELLRYYDPELGGWGKRQKAPVADAVEHALWKAYRTQDSVWRKRALSSLLTQRTLLDPVWGGFYQYSAGGGWDRPHYEKIMTVQAGALENYAQAYHATRDERFLGVARMMIAYFNASLSDPQGGFYTSQDADTAQIAGHDYFCLSDSERRRIGMPRIDKHVYAKENGLAISAFCKAYAATGEPAALQRALKAADAVLAGHGNGKNGFFHAAGEKQSICYLADNAAFGKALLDCYEATGMSRYLNQSIAVAQYILREFASSNGEGFYSSTADPKAAGVFAERQKSFQDNALVCRFFLKLAGYTRDKQWRAAAEKTLAYLSDEVRIKDEGRFIGNYLLATEEFLNEPLHLLVLGSKTDPRAKALHDAALAYYAPYKILEWQDPGEKPRITKNYPAFDHPVIYVCGTNRCSSPIAYSKDLSAAIGEFLNQ